MHHQTHPVLFSLLLLLTVMSTASYADSEIEHEVEDLSYGLSLFHFYQGKYFSAISDILVAKHYKRLSSEDRNPELLLGGLYLSYGLQHKSSDIFSRIIQEETESESEKKESDAGTLTEKKDTVKAPWVKKPKVIIKTPQYVRDRAWFHLGKNHYQNGFIEDAEMALSSIKDTLSKEYEAERLFILTNIYTQTNRITDAQKVLDKFDTDSVWFDYARFNVGAALIKDNKTEDGTQLLKELTVTQSENRERRILQDKANLALAYTSLKSDNPVEAGQYFQTVRLNDTEATKALLGIGWSWYKQNKFDNSLTPWMELANREKSDPSVQEALVTIPNSFEKINNHSQALHQYNLAISVYQEQLDEIEKVLKSIHSGDFLDKLKLSSLGEEATTPFSILFNINASSNQYLLPLISSKEFHDALKTYQEVVYLSYTLNHWQQGLPALNLILREKIKRYNSKLTDTVHDPKIKLSKTLRKRRNVLANKLYTIRKKEDALQLATIEEQEKIYTLKKARKIINKNIDDFEEEDEKQKLLYGLMYWDIATDYKPRVWEARKNLKELDKALYEMSRSMYSLNKVWKDAPSLFGDFSKQIKEKLSRIISIKKEMSVSLKQQEEHLKNMALKVIYTQRNRLKLYNDRAMFSRARIYDSLIVKE
jgi:hypothetical protein